MPSRPNVLWLMSDQHNANCTGYASHPDVKTPALDRIASRGVEFTRAFANNPICSPSRICFMTGQYMHTHGMFGNDHSEWPHAEPSSLAYRFRLAGYQTGLFGKSHMVRRWDEDAFERIRYTDLCDAVHGDPTTTHYFEYLADRGLADLYEEGNPKPGQEYTLDGSKPAALPYEHSIERFTGDETLRFLDERDADRPFFIHMSFQRPHAPIAPSTEHFDMYDPARLTLPGNHVDYMERDFAGKPEFMRERLRGGCGYPLATKDAARLRRCLASYYALITAIDSEIGRVLDYLETMGELDNTIIFYTADHGDFAGEHGLFHKNFGLYDSIVRIPFLLSWPGGPAGARCDQIVESVDLYPTLCELCGVEMPPDREGASVLPLVAGTHGGKDASFCEWGSFIDHAKINAIRTLDFRLVFYDNARGGELYDHRTDPGELDNRWDDPAHTEVRRDLTERLLSFITLYRPKTDGASDRYFARERRYAPTNLLHKHARYWGGLQKAYHEESPWPPGE